jgi:2'-hydroxyisoflavone reductase
MDSALLVGGTRFIGRYTVEELLAHDYDITLFTRSEHNNPFESDDRVNHVQGDRNEREDLERAFEAVAPDLVVDFVVRFPKQARVAADVFSEANAYVYVSSGSAYAGVSDIPLREDETPLHDCTDEQAIDESTETYGPRKAECDRLVTDAATDDFRAVAVRPMLVYGPHDYTERFDYWLSLVTEYDNVLVPGNGDSVLHRAFVGDVASALRIAGERGKAGEAYNVADRSATTIDGALELAANVMNTDVDLVHTAECDLAIEDLTLMDFPHVAPQPAIAATEKLHALGWNSIPLTAAMERTIEEHRESTRDGSESGPPRERTEAIIDRLR